MVVNFKRAKSARAYNCVKKKVKSGSKSSKVIISTDSENFSGSKNGKVGLSVLAIQSDSIS